MDRVTEILRAIAGLRPQEKEKLFKRLAAEGDLPERHVPPGLEGQQQALMPSDPQHSWSPDYILTFDGGSLGNPGQGYGSYAITRVKDGARRLERLQFGDEYTNNEAEYDTLVAALHDLVRRIEQSDRQSQEFALEVRGDSALVINQLLGRWQAKEPRMRERRDRCLRLLRRFGSVKLTAQPREESVRVLGH